jgi:hypothetical protein
MCAVSCELVWQLSAPTINPHDCSVVETLQLYSGATRKTYDLCSALSRRTSLAFRVCKYLGEVSSACGTMRTQSIDHLTADPLAHSNNEA